MTKPLSPLATQLLAQVPTAVLPPTQRQRAGRKAWVWKDWYPAIDAMIVQHPTATAKQVTDWMLALYASLPPAQRQPQDRAPDWQPPAFLLPGTQKRNPEYQRFYSLVHGRCQHAKALT